MKLTLKEIDHLDHLAEEAMKIFLHGWDVPLSGGLIESIDENDCQVLSEKAYKIALTMMKARKKALVVHDVLHRIK